jgi:DNA primase large subunit
MARDESIKRLASKIAEDIEEMYGKPPNFIQLQALIRRFVENNPKADPEDIDWVGVWDPKLEYTEIISRFKEQYPMYRWDEEQEYTEERYFQELYDYLLTQAKDLPEDFRLRLIKELAFELGVQPPTPTPPTIAEAKAVEAAIEKPRPRKVTVTLELLAKYPMIPEVLKFLSGIKMSQISEEVAGRAFKKIAESIEYGEVKSVTENYYIEILSYPTCVMILTIVGNNWLQRRWALAEAIRLEKQLDIEDDVTFDFVASKLGFEKVDVDSVEHPLLREYGYRLPVTRYLRVIGDLLRDVRWKLVNQLVHRGHVYIKTRAEVSRMVREIMKNLLIQKFQKVSPKDVPKDMPQYFWETVEEVKKLLAEKAPKHMVVQVRGDIPPCIAQIISKIRAGEDVSHVENFTVAAYMVNSGYSIEEVLEVFKDRADYDEKIARYQVEHIAGIRGSRTKYKPPGCSRMKSYGLCLENGSRCPRHIKNPLSYRVEKTQIREAESSEDRQVS